MKKLFIFSLLLLLLAGCAITKSAPWHQSTLYFGLSQQDGSIISQQQWQHFVDAEISPRFPDGFTVLNGDGQWKDNQGKIAKEPSRVVIILHPALKEYTVKISELRQFYKQRYHQQSVLLTTQAASVEF